MASYSNIIFAGAFIIGICCVWAWRSTKEENEVEPEREDPEHTTDPIFEDVEREVHYLLGKYAILANQLQVNALTEDLYRYIANRQEQSYREGLMNVPVGDLKYTRGEVISFAQNMIEQYHQGNTNIRNYHLINESLPKK